MIHLTANDCPVVPRPRRKPRVPRETKGQLRAIRMIWEVMHPWVRGNPRPAYGQRVGRGAGQRPGRSDGRWSGPAGGRAPEPAYGAELPCEQALCSQGDARHPAEPSLVGPAHDPSASPPLQQPQQRGRSLTDPEIPSTARPTRSTWKTPWSWGRTDHGGPRELRGYFLLGRHRRLVDGPAAQTHPYQPEAVQLATAQHYLVGEALIKRDDLVEDG
jgi:hypothetical protein